jgi:FMN phosphatase YigB (HAD superfamily)
MLIELMGHCLRNADPALLRRLQTFRRERERLAEAEAEGIAVEQYARPARMLGLAPEVIRNDVRLWIDRRPLRHLGPCRFAGVAELFARLRSSGRRIAVVSDYPAQEKLAALGLSADLSVAAEDEGVNRLKPHPAGLLRVLERLELGPEQCLMIGDRDERDGESARRAGVPYLLKSRRPKDDPRWFCSYAELEIEG